ncbi:hypothetical protein [Kineococcus esterisolvens]|uniref:hypothetical protein n=1 Tax=Kineococcus sp. SYSU DK016 TaxID=3383137 RepID=UPI003D7E0A75
MRGRSPALSANQRPGSSAVAMDPANSTSAGPSTISASSASAASTCPTRYSARDRAVAKYSDSTRSRRSRVRTVGTAVATNASTTTEFVASSCG